MPGSVRREWENRNTPILNPLIEFEVLDPGHQPDMNGELAGGKVYRKGLKQFVRLTVDQARFYLDSGSIAPVSHEEQPMSLRPAQRAAGMVPEPEPEKKEPEKK
jgi:hypothetical protein